MDINNDDGIGTLHLDIDAEVDAMPENTGSHSPSKALTEAS